ncbi:restriction endonuclease subunit S [Bacillus sp. D48C]
MSDYKKTPIGLFPNNWTVKKNGELFDNKSIKNFPDEPVLSVTQDKGVLPRNLLEKRITMENSNSATFKLVDKGDFIISLRSFQGGLEVSEYRGIVSPAYTVIKPKLPIVTDFFKYYFKSNKFINILDKAVIGIRDGKQISFSVFSELFTPYPPLQEQSKIAKILSSIDEAIEKTKDIIEQTEQVKKGLMQQFFAKGIGHTKFKKTEIGEIPEEWEVVKVGELCESIVPGRNKPKEFNGSIPWITVSDIDGPYITTSKSGNFVSREELERVGGKIIPPNSVIMTCVGTFGITAVVKTAITINQQLHAFVCPPSVNPLFLSKVLELKESYMKKLATQTTIPYLNKSNCNSIPVPLPSLEEQNTISHILGMQDAKLNNELKKLETLKFLKQGLMQSLLTGKVRVKGDEAEVTNV